MTDLSMEEQQARLRKALSENPLSETQVRMLNVLAANPGATAQELAEQCGYPDQATWNSHFGRLCSKLEPALWPAPDSLVRKGEKFYSGLLTDGGGHSFTLKPHLDAVFCEAGIIDAADQPIQDPPGFIIETEAEKAAGDNGYRIKAGIRGGWLHYRSTTAPGEIAIAGASDRGPWYLKTDHNGVAAELGASQFTFDDQTDLYAVLNEIYRLSISLPDMPLRLFEEEKKKLPQTTEAERLVVQRRGQDLFRKALLAYWNSTCPLTGITDPCLLRASHIVPWSECDSDEHRLDVHNGLLLSALWDAAFDQGLISFADDGAVLVSDDLSPEARACLNLDADHRIGGLTEAHKTNLARHRRANEFE